jgi:hypothetical protein
MVLSGHENPTHVGRARPCAWHPKWDVPSHCKRSRSTALHAPHAWSMHCASTVPSPGHACMPRPRACLSVCVSYGTRTEKCSVKLVLEDRVWDTRVSIVRVRGPVIHCIQCRPQTRSKCPVRVLAVSPGLRQPLLRPPTAWQHRLVTTSRRGSSTSSNNGNHSSSSSGASRTARSAHHHHARTPHAHLYLCQGTRCTQYRQRTTTGWTGVTPHALGDSHSQWPACGSLSVG